MKNNLENFSNIELKNELSNRGYIMYGIWHTNDIRILRPNFTEDQVENVKANIENNFDAQIGINWFILEDACEEE